MIGEEIRRLAEAKGLTTQQKLAEASGLSQSFIARLYAGQRPNLTAEVLYKLCDALGVSCDHFRPFLAGEADVAPSEPVKKRPKKGK